VFQKLEVRNVFFAVAFEVHLSEDAAQHIGISRQTMVEADTLTTIHLTADALALPGSTRKGKIVREKVELGKKKQNKTSHPLGTLCNCKCHAGGVGGNMHSSVAPFLS